MSSEQYFFKVIPGLREKLKEIAGGIDIAFALKHSKALLAGGSALSLLLNNEENIPKVKDLDVYVNQKYSGLFKSLVTANSEVISFGVVTAHAYSHNFFHRNGIASKEEFYITNKVSIDLMSTVKKPIQVVTDFDLSCCQVWYDGNDEEKLYFSHEETLEKICIFNQAYTPLLLKSILQDRIKKYTKKGFKVIMEFDGKWAFDKDSRKSKFLGKTIDLMAVTLDREGGQGPIGSAEDIILEGKFSTDGIEIVDEFRNFLEKKGLTVRAHEVIVTPVNLSRTLKEFMIIYGKKSYKSVFNFIGHQYKRRATNILRNEENCDWDTNTEAFEKAQIQYWLEYNMVLRATKIIAQAVYNGAKSDKPLWEYIDSLYEKCTVFGKL